MAGKGPFIYLINTVEGIYIGKLVDENVWQSHLRRTSLPWYNKSSPEESDR